MSIQSLFSSRFQTPRAMAQAAIAPQASGGKATENRDVFKRSAEYRAAAAKPAKPATEPTGRFEELTELKSLVEKLLAPKPAPAPAEPPAPPPPPPAPTYTVARGDSLSGIAGRTLGNQDRWREIFDLNRDQIANPDQISAGQVLKLPGGANTAPPPPPSPANGRNSDRGAIYMKQPNNWTCGPTSLTMAAAAFGVRPLGVGTVDELTAMTHTRPEYGVPDRNQLPNAAKQLGLQSTPSRDSSPQAVRDALNAGRGVILNGSLGSGGHFLYVAGLNPDGSFIICDPWRPEITRMNDGELDHFAHNRGGFGGMIEIWR